MLNDMNRLIKCLEAEMVFFISHETTFTSNGYMLSKIVYIDKTVHFMTLIDNSKKELSREVYEYFLNMPSQI